MKNLLVALLAIFVLSCSPPAAEPEVEAEPAADANMEAFERNTETAKVLLEHFMNDNLDGMRALLTDDFVYVGPVYGADSMNVDQWMEQEKSFMDTYDNISCTDGLFFAGLADDMTPNGDVRFYCDWTFTHAETGWTNGIHYYSVIFFNEEGKINRIMDWFNTSDLYPPDSE